MHFVPIYFAEEDVLFLSVKRDLKYAQSFQLITLTRANTLVVSLWMHAYGEVTHAIPESDNIISTARAEVTF